ncbi:hypothetical protein DFH06DRAFT_1162098 [Mycena polygramma]|nr:hypothetical protein DFH06DRAFT_1162098 [Mycena polygramma]
MFPLLFALTFTSSCNALPIPIHSNGLSAPACLITVLATLLGLLILILLKRVYIRKTRRRNQARQNTVVALSAGSASASLDSVAAHEKAGFLVGFFGSPTVEIQSALDKADWKENKQSSFTYQIHTESRRHRVDYPSVLDISRLRNCSVSSSPTAPDKKPALREPHSFKLPSFPDKAHLNSSVPHPRRFSLPNLNRNLAHDSHRRRYSSLKIARSRRSASFARSPSLRIDSSPGRVAPLARSPQLSEVSTASPTPSFISASNPSSPKIGSRLSRSFIPPLPPLPFMNVPPNTAQRIGSFQISHPYALSPYSRKNVHSSPPSQTEYTLPEEVYHPAGIDANSIPSGLTVHDPALSPPLSSFPSPPFATSILKPKLRIRTRRSPAIPPIPIGPSPLRTMILPDSESRPMSVHSPYASSGGAIRVGESGSSGARIGAARGASDNVGPKARRRPASVSSCHASEVEEDDPNVLLGIIRELVEETSEWDQSGVFMNQSFKNLLQESGMSPANSAHGDFVAEEAPITEFYESNQSSRSAEIDLGLLGLDFFKSDSFFDGRADSSTKMMSFLDEASLAERSEVGLAW